MYCLNCGSKVGETDKFCTNCGSKIGEENNICTNCGARFEKNDKFCTNCGSKVGNIIYEKELKIAGTSYHQDELKKIARNGLKEQYITAYKDMTNAEIKEFEERVGQIEFESLKAITLQPHEFDGEMAIRLLADDFYGNYLEVGHIPKEEVDDLLPLIENQEKYRFKVDGYFVGGKYKEYDPYEEKVVTEELAIGIRLNIKVTKK